MHEPKPPIKTSVSIHASLTEHVEVTVEGFVDVSIDEVLREIDDDDLAAALDRRGRKQHGKATGSKLTLIYEEFARRGDAPQVLKDFIYETIGRIL